MKARNGVDERLTYGARLVLSRNPTEGELAILRRLFEDAMTMPDVGPTQKASNAQGQSGKELAALTAVASVLFNLDAALTR